MIGQTISHYKIIEKLGAGGMGVVYKAQDTKLNRAVALKFLPLDLTHDAETIDRFVNEAQAASALDHANICTIHEIGETEEGQMFIVMAYYAGETLQEKIKRGPLPVEEAIDIFTQAAQGLERAHEAGITHRDIKPSNLIITPRGEVKIIDFGLAKLTGQTRLTKTGSTLGTVAYMSPEQVQAQPVNHRTDIWSLGVVLYEMLTGKLPFRGDYEAAMIYSIINEKPALLVQHRTGVPEDLQQIIDKALVKNVEARYQHIDDLLADLKGESKSVSHVRHPLSRFRANKPSRAIWKYAAAAVVAVLAVVASVSIFNWQPKPDVQPRHKQVTFTGNAFSPTLSRDGKWIAYVESDSGASKLMVQEQAGGQAIEVISEAEWIGGVQWSPVGSELLFVSAKGIFLIPRLGGNARRISASGLFSWSPDGKRIASIERMGTKRRRIQFTNKRTDDTTSISLTGDYEYILDVDWSPLGNRLLFATYGTKTGNAIWTVNINGSQQEKIIEDNTALLPARWAHNGEGIYYFRKTNRVKNLMKLNISTSTGKATSSSSLLQAGLTAGDVFNLSGNDQKLIYTREFENSNLNLIEIGNPGGDQAIQTKMLTKGTGWNHHPSISPDGSKIAFSSGYPYRANIFVIPINGGKAQQLTFGDWYDASPAWSPDGKQIAFGSNRNGKHKVWIVSSAGGAPRPFANSELIGSTYFVSWSPGARIMYQRPENRNYHFLDPETGEEQKFVETDSVVWIWDPKCSPDGKKIAVFWNRDPQESNSGLWIVDLEDSSQRLLQKGSLVPIRWSADGKTIYAWRGDATSIEVLMIPFDGGKSKTLAKVPFEMIALDNISMTPDGKRLVFPASEVKSDVWLMENFDPEVALK